MQIYPSHSEQDTVAIAANFAKSLIPGSVVALFGGLGMGKTAFVRGLAMGFGLDPEQVCSPTFSLVNEYSEPGKTTLHHFDMYRVTGQEALLTTGFYDSLDSGGVLAVEWSENIAHALPGGAINVTISRGISENEREIAISCGKGLKS